MPRFRTAAAATLLVIPIVAGGFLLQEPPARANAVLFDQVMHLVANAYVDTLPTAIVYQKAAAGLVKELNDPYSELLSPKASEDFNRSTGGRYGGTGMLLGSPSAGVVIVQTVFPNTPAEEGGVREGDHVMSVDNTQTSTVDFAKVSDLLRGTPGSQVTVVYQRPGVTEPIKLTFTRRVIHVPAVAFTHMFGHVGYIPLQTFNENAAEEVEAAVDSLVRAGATGLVLDMRDNGGGIVDQAQETASLFLREGQEIASVRSRSQPTEFIRSTGKHLALTVPLVVLVDGGSASATEIVAGSLQDHDRALVLGTRSFGKGLVQSVYELNGGYQLKMTTGKWYTPSGRSIHRERKLLPDGEFVIVKPDSGKDGKDTVTRAMYKSDAGRALYGGGGIRPDIVVPDDTIPTLEREFFRAVAPDAQRINGALQDYALELKGTVPRDFAVPATWPTEIMNRLTKLGIKIDAKYDSTARASFTRDLEQRVTRLSFGDGAAKARALPDDHQLEKAIELLQQSPTQAKLLAAATSGGSPTRER